MNTLKSFNKVNCCLGRLNVIEKDKKDGVNLSDNEIKELYEMYNSGKYYIKEILEYFGINRLRLERYLEIAKDRLQGINQKGEMNLFDL